MKKKPLTCYPGGKNGDGTYQQIINLMPPHDIYIEPFLGSGAIMRRKRPAKFNIGIDINPEVSANFMMPAATQFNTGIVSVSRTYQIKNANAISFLESFQILSSIITSFDISCLIYCDPPYPINSRSCQRKLYTYEMTDSEHIQFLSLIQQIPAQIMISTYENDLYSKTLSKWNLHKFQSNTRRGPATEFLYFNFDTPKELHDYSFLGNNFRERERYRGIINRTVSKFHRMPDQLRNAILSQLK